MCERFICSARHIARTTMQLSNRTKEHSFAALSKGAAKSVNSSISQHLVDSYHRVDPNQTFNIICQIPHNLPKYVRRTNIIHIHIFEVHNPTVIMTFIVTFFIYHTRLKMLSFTHALYYMIFTYNCLVLEYLH